MNLTIRKAVPDDAYDYSDAHIASWRYAYKGIVPDDYLDRLSVDARVCWFYEKCGYVADGAKKEINIGKPLTEIRLRRNL